MKLYIKIEIGGSVMKNILNALANAGYDYGVAIATKAEVQAGAACGQLSLILEEDG